MYENENYKYINYDSLEICPLCKLPNNYPLQQHLLSDCPSTITYVQRFFLNVERISKQSYKTLKNIPPENRWLWILRASEFCRNKDYSWKHPISEGYSVTPRIDKQNLNHRVDAIMEHAEILKAIPKNSVVIYTDGSKREDKCGSGAVIYFNQKIVGKIAYSINHCENNFAELYAIYKSLKYVQSNIQILKRKEIHIFTDSRFSIDVLTLTTQSHTYNRIINQIFDEMSTKSSPSLILHWVPSHISILENGKQRTIEGNEIADELASNAAKCSGNKVLDIHENFIQTPKLLLHAAAELTSAIDSLALTVSEHLCSENVGPSSDDCSTTVASQITSLRSSVTSSDVKLN